MNKLSCHSDVVEHSLEFAEILVKRRSDIDRILRRYQSKEVVDDELYRSIDTLSSMGEIQNFFLGKPLVDSCVSFLPLNLPLYSFILFGAMPAYQASSVTIRAPKRMGELFAELFNVLSVKEYYPNISLFSGTRSAFLSNYCTSASVIIFTGKLENLLRIRREFRRDALILYSGVGHNPLVITNLSVVVSW